MTDTTFFMVERQNIVNSGVYKRGRVEEGELLLYVWVSFSLLFLTGEMVSTVISPLHLGFVSKTAAAAVPTEFIETQYI